MTQDPEEETTCQLTAERSASQVAVRSPGGLAILCGARGCCSDGQSEGSGWEGQETGCMVGWEALRAKTWFLNLILCL